MLVFGALEVPHEIKKRIFSGFLFAEIHGIFSSFLFPKISKIFISRNIRKVFFSKI